MVDVMVERKLEPGEEIVKMAGGAFYIFNRLDELRQLAKARDEAVINLASIIYQDVLKDAIDSCS